jgi:Plasmid pRiA4b ORF-3-like protein
MTQQPQSAAIYQLRLVLTGISPMIWRRLLISSESSIAQLHEYIQICFDWNNEHLHCFRIQGKNYGIAYLGGMSFDDDAHDVRLSRFHLHPHESFHYDYDFLANWRVKIRLEGILPSNPRRPVPVCTGGRGAAPREEYWGALAYLQKLEHQRYAFPLEELEMIAAAMQRWLKSGGSRQAVGAFDELREAVEHVRAYQEFQPRRCDRHAINRKLWAMGQEAAA